MNSIGWFLERMAGYVSRRPVSGRLCSAISGYIRAGSDLQSKALGSLYLLTSILIASIIYAIEKKERIDPAGLAREILFPREVCADRNRRSVDDALRIPGM